MNATKVIERACFVWSEGDRDQANRLFEEAIKIDLGQSIQAAVHLAAQYRMSEADVLLQTAAEHSTDAEEIAKIAEHLAKMYRLPKAIDIISSFQKLDESPQLLARLAVYFELSGQFQRAEDCLRRCLQLSPNQSEASFVLARLLIHQEKLADADDVLKQVMPESSMSSSAPSSITKIRYLYEKARLLDRRGEFNAAVNTVQQAKELQKARPQSSSMAKGMLSRLQRLGTIYRELTPELLDRWSEIDLSNAVLPIRPAHLLGFPRSGTTLLEQRLSSHPSLCVSSERMVFANEVVPGIFRDDSSLAALEGCSRDQIARLRQRYITFLNATHASGINGLTHLDKKPANTPYLALLLRLLPESRYVIAIRDPRDVLVSSFMTYFPMTDMSACFLSWGSTALLFRQFMEIWLFMREIMVPESWIEVRYEEFCAAPHQHRQEIWSFLGLENKTNEATLGDANTFVHSPTFAEVTKPTHLSRIGRWENYRHHLESFLEPVTPIIDLLGYS